MAIKIFRCRFNKSNMVLGSLLGHRYPLENIQLLQC